MGPAADNEIAGWVRSLGIDGMVDLHTHFLPDAMLRKVWAYFDRASEHYGMDWPIRYRTAERERLATLRSFGVIRFAPLVYPHKPGMAEWLNDWALEFAESVPDAVRTATLYPEATAESYVDIAVRAGVRCVKAHVQVGAYDPRSPLLDAAWGRLAEARVPVIIHCGHGPLRGEYTGLDVFAEVLRRHPTLTVVLAHAGMPEYEEALRLVANHPRVYLDTTMVGVPFTEAMMALPGDWPARLVPIADRIVLGTDFPNIPYDYAVQLRAIAGWAAADERLGDAFLRRVLHDTPLALIDGAHPGGEPETQ